MKTLIEKRTEAAERNESRLIDACEKNDLEEVKRQLSLLNPIRHKLGLPALVIFVKLHTEYECGREFSIISKSFVTRQVWPKEA